jgi:hypothetical protein
MKKSKGAFLTFIASFIIMLPMDVTASEKYWYVTVYGAVQTGEDLPGILTFPSVFKTEYKFVSLGVGRKIGAWREFLDLELEGQAVRHFDKQNYYEFTGAFVVRWLKFPWDKYLDTSFAVGEGLSVTTEISELELDRHGKAAKLLNYLSFELAFVVPGTQNWSLVLRTHHRSGVFGLFQDIYGASNALAIGIRYDFK